MVWKWLFGSDDDEEELVNEDGKLYIKDKSGNTREADEDETERAYKFENNKGTAESKGWKDPNPENIDNQDWWA